MEQLQNEKKIIIKNLNIKKINVSEKDLEYKSRDDRIHNIVREYIKEGKSLIQLVTDKCPRNIDMRKLFTSVYHKLEDEEINNITKKSIKDNLIRLSKKKAQIILHDYQIKYVDAVHKELLTVHKCILKSPTGSGKTIMCFTTIAKLFKTLELEHGELKSFNILYLAPRLKLCSQSIKDTPSNTITHNNEEDEDILNTIDASNRDILISAGLTELNFLEYNFKASSITETALCENPYFNFISSTYQSLDKLTNFIQIKKLKFDIVIYDEFHCILSYHRDDIKCKKFLQNELFVRKIFTSATPYYSQEVKTDLYGNLINYVNIKDLIENQQLCNIIPLIEIEYEDSTLSADDKLKTKYEKLPYMIREIFNKYNKKKAILFCNSTAGCIRIYELLNKYLNGKGIIDNTKKIKIFRPYVGKININKYNTNNEDKKPISGENIKINDTSSNLDSSETEYCEADALLKEIEDLVNNKDKDNEQILKEYENCKELCILITCKKIDIGYDHKPIDLIIFADNKNSFIDISQCIGRGLRKDPNNPNKECHVALPIIMNNICSNNYKNIISVLEYMKNNVGINIIDTIIRTSINSTELKRKILFVKKLGLTIEMEEPTIEYLNNLIKNYYIKLTKNIKYINGKTNNHKKIIEDALIEDELYNKQLMKMWIEVYYRLVIHCNKKGSTYMLYDDPETLALILLKDKVNMNDFKHKKNYIIWAQKNGYDEHPEITFKLKGWKNWYDFLNIDISKYPKNLSEWEKQCILLNIKTIDDYKNNYKNNMPSMPEELYNYFGNIDYRVKQLYKTDDDTDIDTDSDIDD